jgi:hypothetical protein
MVVANLDCRAAQVQGTEANPINKMKSRGQRGSNIHLTKSGQNAYLWTFCDHDEGIGGSRQAAKFLKLKRFFIFYNKNMKNSQKLKIDYI